MTFKNSVEYLYFALMLRWEENAPPDKHEGLLDGEPARNTQITRMAYIVRKIAAGRYEERTYQVMARHSRRNDGRSYVSTDSSWMKEPYPLSKGWYFEGCTNLKKKQEIVQSLTHMGISQFLIDCIDDFIAGKSITARAPTEFEADEILQRSIEEERRQEEEDDA